MINIFKNRAKTVCFFCSEPHNISESYAMEYDTKDGLNEIPVCPKCAGHLDSIIDIIGAKK